MDGLSELLVAGYQKYLEGDFWGLANATQETKDAMLEYGEPGLHLDGHSRGAMTVGNAMDSLNSEGYGPGTLSGTTISFFGPAYNAAVADNTLSYLQGRDAVADPQQRQDMVLTLQNHMADPVGRFIGGNPPTGGTIPQGTSWIGQVWRAATGQTNTSHNCYGAPMQGGCGPFWLNTPGHEAVSMPINSVGRQP
jgi:filamentous hemagglutinin